MNTNEDEVFCKGCGAVLKNFLQEMAEHNAKVACPRCGKVYTREEAEAMAKTARQAAKGSHS
jgi:predicted  nucleic acid-binding Zn-ribbon protein